MASTLCLYPFIHVAHSAEYYVSPDGKPDAAGTADAPWDLVSALDGTQPARPGDVIWIRGGKYRSEAAYRDNGAGFTVKLTGTEREPIHVRACKGERVIMDGGVRVVDPSSYLWLWDLEITVAPDEEVPRETDTPGSHPDDLGAPYGGLNIYAGQGCKYINLVVQDNFGGGVGWWAGSTKGELYGCIIVNNGWKGPDRCHGHCVYTQNQEGTKVISNCIMTTRWGQGQYTMHAYGSERAYVDNLVIEDNIAYGPGAFLVGGGRPSRNIVVRRNYLYHVPMRIGYSAPHNENCQIHDNIIIGAGIGVKRYREASVHNNLIANGTLDFENCENVEQWDNRVLQGDLPLEARVVLLPNKYDANRANLAVYNPENAQQVEVDVSAFLNPGETFRLVRAEHFFGEPAIEGTCQAETIEVPMEGEFGAFVLLRDGRPGT